MDTETICIFLPFSMPFKRNRYQKVLIPYKGHLKTNLKKINKFYCTCNSHVSKILLFNITKKNFKLSKNNLKITQLHILQYKCLTLRRQCLANALLLVAFSMCVPLLYTILDCALCASCMDTFGLMHEQGQIDGTQPKRIRKNPKGCKSNKNLSRPNIFLPPSQLTAPRLAIVTALSEGFIKKVKSIIIQGHDNGLVGHLSHKSQVECHQVVGLL